MPFVHRDRRPLQPRRLSLPQAENDPSPSADFSKCGLEDLPRDLVAAVCLRKEALLLHDNLYTTLPASIRSLTRIRVLDLHSNYIARLPQELSRLAELRVRVPRAAARELLCLAAPCACGHRARDDPRRRDHRTDSFVPLTPRLISLLFARSSISSTTSSASFPPAFASCRCCRLLTSKTTTLQRQGG